MKERIKYCVRFLKSDGKYNMTISDKHRYVWFRVAKVGTRSILLNLRNLGGIDFDDSYKKFDQERYKDYYQFAFVRNPWDRLVSSYSDKVLGKQMFSKCWGKDFEYFVNYVSEFNLKYADRHIRPQSYLVPEKVDFLGRFESLSDDYNQLIRNLKIELPALPHKNSTKKKDYRSYYDTKLASLVEDLYQTDIERFGYAFEE